MERLAKIERQTGETTIDLELNLDGSGRHQIDTGLVMLDHMLAQLAKHGVFDLTVTCKASMDPDGHHTVEDVAIALGQALNRALGDKQGIARMGHMAVPLDEALSMVTIDLSGRGYAHIQAEFRAQSVGDLQTDLVRHFLETFAREGKFNLHAEIVRGVNDHHKVECLFKALARALDAATRIDVRIGEAVPSTKGVIES